jgi:hypothetical protein
MTGTGPLLAFKTLRLVGIPMMGFGYPPWFSGSILFPATLWRLLLVVTITSRPRLPMPQRRYWDIQVSFPDRQGFVLRTVARLRRP